MDEGSSGKRKDFSISEGGGAVCNMTFPKVMPWQEKGESLEKKGDGSNQGGILYR